MLLTYFSALADRLSQNKQVSFIRPTLAAKCEQWIARQLTTVKRHIKVDNVLGYAQVKA